MKEKLSLTVDPRKTDENVKTLRKAGQVPGVIYGRKIKNQTIKCQQKALHMTYVKAGENQLVTLEIGEQKIPCLIHAVSFEPVRGSYEHVDFYAVDMTKKVTTRVPVLVEGESPAVKTLGGVLVTVHDELEVSCLPSDIPESFVVNIGKLENFHDSVSVADLKIPAGVSVVTPAGTVIVTVQEPRKEEVIETPVAATEGAVPAEGEAAAPGAEGAAAPGAAPGAPGKAEEKAPAGKEKKK